MRYRPTLGDVLDLKTRRPGISNQNIAKQLGCSVAEIIRLLHPEPQP